MTLPRRGISYDTTQIIGIPGLRPLRSEESPSVIRTYFGSKAPYTPVYTHPYPGARRWNLCIGHTIGGKGPSRGGAIFSVFSHPGKVSFYEAIRFAQPRPDIHCATAYGSPEARRAEELRYLTHIQWLTHLIELLNRPRKY